MAESVISEPRGVPFQTIDDGTIFIRIEWGGKYQNIYVAPIELKGTQMKETLRLVKQSLIELAAPKDIK